MFSAAGFDPALDSPPSRSPQDRYLNRERAALTRFQPPFLLTAPMQGLANRPELRQQAVVFSVLVNRESKELLT